MGEFAGGDNYGMNLRDASRILSDFDEAIETSKSDDFSKKIQFNKNYLNNIEDFFNTPYDKRITLLHSVRGTGNEEPSYVNDFFKTVRSEGKQVYIPKLYNFQEDETGGINICNTMRYVIENSKTVAVAYNPDSEGIKFDLGISMFFNKNIILLNTDLSDKLLNVTFDKMDYLYQYLMIKSNNLEDAYGFMDDAYEARRLFKEQMNEGKPFELALEYISRPERKIPMLDPDSAVIFGTIYASRHPFILTNIEKVLPQIVLENNNGITKSYSKVALQMHYFHRTISALKRGLDMD